MRLNREIATALGAPDTQQRMRALGAEPVSSTPEAFAAYVKMETERWGKVVRANGIKAQ